jgi:hypothetical protein
MVGATRLRRATLMATAVLLGVAPACGPDGFTAPWLRGPDPASPYVVNRPAYADGARPFFVSGYAGANYEPIVGGPRAAFGIPLPGPAPPPPPGLPAGPPPELPAEVPAVPTEPLPAPPAGTPRVSVSQGSWETE